METVVLSGNSFLREGIVASLREEGTVDVVGAVETTQQARELLAELRPRTLLIDMQAHDSLDAIRDLTRAFPKTQVVALDVSSDCRQLFHAVECGAIAFMSRDASIHDVVSGLLNAAERRFVCSRTVAASLLRKMETASMRSDRLGVESCGLTARENQIAALLARGLANKEIAKSLGIQLSTVKNHVHNILAKLGAHSRGEVAAMLADLNFQGTSHTEL